MSSGLADRAHIVAFRVTRRGHRLMDAADHLHLPRVVSEGVQ